MKNILSLFLLLSLFMIPRPTAPSRPVKKLACDVRAFPNAVGFGTTTPGGRGGQVIYVTNLQDSGPGSLREAIETPGPRTVLFQVSGTITLKDDIEVLEPFLTIAGQTAPGEGVQVRGGHIRIQTHDVLFRYLKIRSGDLRSRSTQENRDSVTVNNRDKTYNIVIDHSTLIWGPDIGGLSFLNGAHDSTVSYSIMGEGLYLSAHPEGKKSQEGHSMSMNITELSSKVPPARITVHHNLLTTSSERNPRVIGGENIDVVNNVIYNWRDSSSQGNPRSLNLIKNFYIRGPMTNKVHALFIWMPTIEDGGDLHVRSVYEEGNAVEGFVPLRRGPMKVYVDQLFLPYSIEVEDTPEAAYRKIVADAGANLQVSNQAGNFQPLRDSVDRRIIENLLKRQGAYFNGVEHDGEEGFAAISWPELATGPAALDADLDGMPDRWEQAFFRTTQRGSPLESSGDFDADGYTDLEEYLNRTNPIRAEVCQ